MSGIRMVDGFAASRVALDAVSPDLAQGELKSQLVSLVADTVKVVTIPDSARYLRIRPVTNDVRFALGEDPVAITNGAWAVGATAIGDTDESRVLADGTSRQLRLLAAATTTVYVECA